MKRKHDPMPIVCPIWEHDWSDYPDRVRVSMEGGKVIDYVREIKQPAPVFKDALDQFTETGVGFRAKRRNRHEV